jgi:hypothetical protein
METTINNGTFVGEKSVCVISDAVTMKGSF